MKRTILVLIFLFLCIAIQAQQDSTYTYIYNCDSCGTFETVSFEPIELETDVAVSAAILPDTSTSTLAQFSSVAPRKWFTASSLLKQRKTVFNISQPRKDQHVCKH